MSVVAVDDNKGGVGKSTLPFALAELLAANRKRRVLVVDLDPQASSSGAPPGRRRVIEAVEEGRTAVKDGPEGGKLGTPALLPGKHKPIVIKANQRRCQ